MSQPLNFKHCQTREQTGRPSTAPSQGRQAGALGFGLQAPSGDLAALRGFL